MEHLKPEFNTNTAETQVIKLDLRGDLSAALLQQAAHERFPKSDRSNWPQLPTLELKKIESCNLNFNQKLQSALTDNWAVYPGISGLLFGATSGSLAKHLAIGPDADIGMRRFKVARAGVIWGLAGFAANYLGGAAASFFSSNDKVELCQKGKYIDALSFELKQQRDYMNGLSEHLKRVLEKERR